MADTNALLVGGSAVVRGPTRGKVIQVDEEIGVFVPLASAAPNWMDEPTRLNVERRALRLGIQPPPPAAEDGPKPFAQWWLEVITAPDDGGEVADGDQ